MSDTTCICPANERCWRTLGEGQEPSHGGNPGSNPGSGTEEVLQIGVFFECLFPPRVGGNLYSGLAREAKAPQMGPFSERSFYGWPPPGRQGSDRRIRYVYGALDVGVPRKGGCEAFNADWPYMTYIRGASASVRKGEWLAVALLASDGCQQAATSACVRRRESESMLCRAPSGVERSAQSRR